MDFAFTEEQDAVRDLANQILADHSSHERLRQIETSHERFDRELWDTLGQANLLGLCLPEAYGGSDMGLSEISILLQEQGRTLAQVPVLATVVLGAMPIAAFGSDAQKKRWLPGVAAGKTILTAALTEYASFDPGRPRVTAKRDGDAWLLDGEKTCVSAGELAARILVPARTGDDTVGVFLLDPTTDGVRLDSQDATNHEPQARITLSGARVAPDDVLGDPQAGLEIVRFIEARAIIGLSSLQLGVAEEALRRTAEYAGVRKQFDRPIGSFQGVSLRTADAYIDIEAMRSTLWQAIWRTESGLPAAIDTSVAKWWACRGGQRVVHTAMHVHGGIGADIDYPIHRFLLWSKQLDLTLGGAPPQLARIGALLAAGEEA